VAARAPRQSLAAAEEVDCQEVVAQAAIGGQGDLVRPLPSIIALLSSPLRKTTRDLGWSPPALDRDLEQKGNKNLQGKGRLAGERGARAPLGERGAL